MQILGLLNKKTTDSQANMAGTATCLMSHTLANDQIVDSGTTHHTITAEKQLKDDPNAKRPLAGWQK